MKKLNLLVILLLSLLLHLYFYTTPIVERIDYFIYDKTNQILNPLKKQDRGSYSVVVDIDEESLSALGQWPWPRILNRDLLVAIDKMNPSSIGINITFPEEDRTSPSSIETFYKNRYGIDINVEGIPPSLKNSDKLFSDAIQRSNATLPIFFTENLYMYPHCDALTFHDNFYKNISPKLEASSLICNTKTLQEKSNKFGFINAELDKDGIFRRIYMFMKYKEQIFPSFSLATLYNLAPNLNLPKDKILLNFPTKTEAPPIYSAIDIFKGAIDKKKIQGKIVVIGSSVIGLYPTYPIPNREKEISNSMIQAIAINNIFTHSFLQQDPIYKTINLFLSFFLSLFMLLLLIKRKYIYILPFFISIFLSSLGYLVYGYYKHQYISLAYMLVPFIVFSITLLLYHINIVTNEEKKQKELLIKQSKLASMGEMISIIAHQWRQPLSAINGVVLTLDIDHNRELLNRDRLDKHLNEIEQLTSYLSETINNFTDFFSTKKEQNSFYIRDIVEEVQVLSAIKNYKNIEIYYTENREIYFHGLKSELLQVLLIILNNAIYACNENIKNTKKGKILINANFEKRHLNLSISDNGGGIKTENLDKIFNPYFTTKLKSHGTGLGLYILKLIVEESMNGKVKIENIEEGVVFTLQLPFVKKKKS